MFDFVCPVQSEINSENFETLVCPGCQMENNHAPCSCVVCAFGRRGERHRITEQEMLHLVREGHLAEPDMERYVLFGFPLGPGMPDLSLTGVVLLL